jgi:hypothetical protein
VLISAMNSSISPAKTDYSLQMSTPRSKILKNYKFSS